LKKIQSKLGLTSPTPKTKEKIVWVERQENTVGHVGEHLRCRLRVVTALTKQGSKYSMRSRDWKGSKVELAALRV
jgi:hypothetical protein